MNNFLANLAPRLATLSKAFLVALKQLTLQVFLIILRWAKRLWAIYYQYEGQFLGVFVDLALALMAIRVIFLLLGICVGLVYLAIYYSKLWLWAIVVLYVLILCIAALHLQIDSKTAAQQDEYHKQSRVKLIHILRWPLRALASVALALLTLLYTSEHFIEWQSLNALWPHQDPEVSRREGRHRAEDVAILTKSTDKNTNATTALFPSKILPGGLLPPLQINDFFIYTRYSYQDGKITKNYIEQEKVIDIEKIGNYMTWVISKLLKLESGILINRSWIDQKTGLYVKYEHEFNYSKPSNVLIRNKTVKAVQEKKFTFTDIQKNTEEFKVLVTDIAGYTHKISELISKPNLTIYKITRQLNTGDWYPWKTIEYNKQVMDVVTISVPAGEFICWMIKHIQSEEHQHYFEYYDVNTGLLVREDNMVNRNGQWEIVDRKELKEFRFSHAVFSDK